MCRLVSAIDWHCFSICIYFGRISALRKVTVVSFQIGLMDYVTLFASARVFVCVSMVLMHPKLFNYWDYGASTMPSNTQRARQSTDKKRLYSFLRVHLYRNPLNALRPKIKWNEVPNLPSSPEHSLIHAARRASDCFVHTCVAYTHTHTHSRIAVEALKMKTNTRNRKQKISIYFLSDLNLYSPSNYLLMPIVCRQINIMCRSI